MSETKDKKKKIANQDDNTAINAGLAGAHAEVVQRYGEANKQHLVGYSGVDRETGQKMA